MPIGQRAGCRVGSQIVLQPHLLRAASRASLRHEAQLRVQGDNVPRTEIVAVIPLRRVSSRRTKVSEIAGGVRSGGAVGSAARLILVVSWHWMRDLLVLSPGRVV